MARVYATPAQLATWLGPAQASPADPDRALRAASRRVDRMLLTAWYDTDNVGMPTEADVIEALMEATCEQVAHQIRTGDPYGTGSAGAYASLSIGGLALTKAAGATGGTSGGPGGSPLSPEAWEILRQAGLTGGEPWTS